VGGHRPADVEDAAVRLVDADRVIRHVPLRVLRADVVDRQFVVVDARGIHRPTIGVDLRCAGAARGREVYPAGLRVDLQTGTLFDVSPGVEHRIGEPGVFLAMVRPTDDPRVVTGRAEGMAELELLEHEDAFRAGL
jgi:hypothetical protein